LPEYKVPFRTANEALNQNVSDRIASPKLHLESVLDWCPRRRGFNFDPKYLMEDSLNCLNGAMLALSPATNRVNNFPML
jgi:hypothetical protein